MLWYLKRKVISFILFYGAHVFQNLGKTINELKIRLHETEQWQTTKTRILTITTNKSSLFTKIYHEYHDIRYGCAQKHATNLFRFALLQLAQLHLVFVFFYHYIVVPHFSYSFIHLLNQYVTRLQSEISTFSFFRTAFFMFRSFFLN